MLLNHKENVCQFSTSWSSYWNKEWAVISKLFSTYLGQHLELRRPLQLMLTRMKHEFWFYVINGYTCQLILHMCLWFAKGRATKFQFFLRGEWGNFYLSIWIVCDEAECFWSHSKVSEVSNTLSTQTVTRAYPLQFTKLHLSQNYFQGVLLKILRNIHVSSQ